NVMNKNLKDYTERELLQELAKREEKMIVREFHIKKIQELSKEIDKLIEDYRTEEEKMRLD
ncbi:1853_t:CDS:1, partial [Racocetra persica]